MRVTRETLIRIAKETALKRANTDPALVAAYLTGSLRTENPFLGNSTDIDMVLVHTGEVTSRREILALTPEVHLDIVHNLRSEYEKPKELRVNPWLGPDLYDSLPLYNTQHFFEFVQAGVRAGYNEPINVMARARRNADHARQIWSGLGLAQEIGPARLLSYLKGVNHAANAIAVLTGSPLGERRFQLQFQERAAAAGVPGLAAGLAGLLGGAQEGAATLKEFLQDWEKAFVEASGRDNVSPGIALPRLGYYKLFFEAMLADDSPQSILWPLVHTWTLSAAVIPPTHQAKWKAACETLGLAGEEFKERMEGLDRFLDTVEETLETMAAHQGI
jgi:hypothetical protein